MQDQDQQEEQQQEVTTQDFQDRYIRLLAEFDNYKRRRNLEDQELSKFAKQVAIVKLLPSLDSIESFLRHFPDPDKIEYGEEDRFTKLSNVMKEWKSGFGGIMAQLDKALLELGITRILTVGEKFDPNVHEAVRTIEGQADDIVIEEYQTGYKIGDMVIRPAQVAIGKNTN